jgi:hypothetical protein
LNDSLDNLLRGLVQSGVHHLKTGVAQGSGDNFSSAIMAVKAGLSDHDSVGAFHR